MKDNEILLEAEQQQGDIVRARTKWPVYVLAFILCLALATLVWVCVMNSQDTDYITLQLEDAAADCTLSMPTVKVEGSVSALKGLTVITVKNKDLAPGTYPLTEQLLELPEGVHLSTGSYVLLTVGD